MFNNDGFRITNDGFCVENERVVAIAVFCFFLQLAVGFFRWRQFNIRHPELVDVRETYMEMVTKVRNGIID